MTKVVPRTLKGFRDFLPETALKRQYVIDKIRAVFESYGYDPIETPGLEYLETFTGQIGEDEKLFFQFEDQGKRKVALRYDQTVPTSRVIAQYQDKITLPFKRYQIQTVWRAEKPQRGRYREFLQCDADIFGIPGAQADAEVIALSLTIFKTLGFKNIQALINDRALYKNIPYPVIIAVDKLKKIGKEAVVKEITTKGYSKTEAVSYLDTIIGFEPNQTILDIFSYLKAAGFSETEYRFEPTLARSFSYSTGPIWEIETADYESGSLLGGERFDKLTGTFSNQSIPATGFALGFDRTYEAMEKLGLLPDKNTNTRLLVTVFSKEALSESLQLAEKLRERNINTEVYPDAETKLDKQLKYADRKKIPFVAVLGPEEVKNNRITLKDMRAGEQKTVTLEEIVKILK